MFGFGLARSASYDLPARLDILARAIPDERVTSGRLLRRHTLFPYYRALRGPAVAGAALKLMAATDRDKSLRRNPFIVGLPDHLRFCPTCYTLMTKEHGEALWLRTHQLPGVLVCPEHGCDLRPSLVGCGMKEAIYQPATSASCPPNASSPLPRLTSKQRDDLVTLARQMVGILNARRPVTAKQAAWGEVLQATCQAKGLTHRNGIDEQIIFNEFENRFGYLRTAWPRLFDREPKQTWVLRVTQNGWRTKYPPHPIATFLIERSIYELPDTVSTTPFGSAPWTCLNPLSPHYGQRVVTEMKLKKKGEDLYRGRFSCECGIVFTRSVDRLGRRSATPAVRSYGKLLHVFVAWSMEHGLSMVEARGISGIQIGRLTGAVRDPDLHARWRWRKGMGPRNDPTLMDKFRTYVATQGLDAT